MVESGQVKRDENNNFSIVEQFDLNGESIFSHPGSKKWLMASVYLKNSTVAVKLMIAVVISLFSMTLIIWIIYFYLIAIIHIYIINPVENMFSWNAVAEVERLLFATSWAYTRARALHGGTGFTFWKLPDLEKSLQTHFTRADRN